LIAENGRNAGDAHNLQVWRRAGCGCKLPHNRYNVAHEIDAASASKKLKTQHLAIARENAGSELICHLIKCAYLEIPRRTTGSTGSVGGLAFSSRKKHCKKRE